MAKVKYSFAAIFLLTVLWGSVAAQVFSVKYVVDATDTLQLEKAALPSTFSSRFEASSYIAGLLPLLQSKGFITASLDSVSIDSSEATIHLFLGDQYKWGSIRTRESDAAVLEATPE